MLLILICLSLNSLSAWADVTSSPVLVSDRVTVSYSGLRLNRATNTYDSLATLTNKSAAAIQTPLQLVIRNISQSGVTIANPGGVLTDGAPYLNVPMSDGVLSPGETVNNILLKFSNPQKVAFTFATNVLGVIPASNHPPIADAGQDLSVTLNSEVPLSAIASSDEDGDSLIYRWQLIEKPTGSAAELKNSNTLQPKLTVDHKGNYRIELIVNDGQIDSQPAYVNISTENSRPVARAGDDQTVKVEQTATLDGIASSDADHDPLTFLWQLLAKPADSQTTITNPDSQTPDLTPDKPGSYTLQLTVNDSLLDSLPDQLVVNTENSKPIANAGLNQIVIAGDHVILDGSLSTDVDEDPLSYVWSILSKPANSTPQLTQHDQIQAILTPNLPGDYVAQLIVNDSKLNSDPATSLVTVSAKPVVNHNPQISSNPLTTATVGNLYTYDVDASDSDNDTLTYSLSAYPTGMSVNSQTGLISWTPASNQVGNQAVSVNVSDGKSGSDSQTFTITVIAAGKVTVPDLVNLSRNVAETAIANAKLTLGIPSFIHNPATSGSVISQSPDAGASVAAGAIVTLTISLGTDQGLPPDPTIVAPKIDSTVATTIFASTQFLYSGSNPIQTGVAPGVIDAKRAAVIRGRVLDKNDAPLAGVAITLLNHPELGHTLSRADGQFDLAVNGGGMLTVGYQKTGYSTAQRQIHTTWQDFAVLDDVVMIQFDPQVTTIDLTAVTPIQIARGSVSADSDGNRRATVLFPQGTIATMTLPDGSTQPLTGLHVRATEFTVGANGPQSMPGTLPPTSAYTYAVDLTVDEAEAAGAKSVSFSQAVPFYVENFLNFPVGIHVPTGYYDKTKGLWVAVPDGRVIKILSISNGIADLDTEGTGMVATLAQLTAMGITDTERQSLAQLYSPGQSLWRVPLNHFSPQDMNWPFVLPKDAKRSSQTNKNTVAQQQQQKKKVDYPTCRTGSIIGCENQTLGEFIPITGTSFSLNYGSDRVPGNKEGYQIDIPLSGVEIPGVLSRIELKITVAGVQYLSTFPGRANQIYTFTWNGLDAFGRPVQGSVPANIEIGYVYLESDYALTSNGFGSFGSGPASTRMRREAILWDNETLSIGSVALNTSDDLGAWAMSNHHVYDPIGKTLFLGNGARRSAAAQTGNAITKVAGTGINGFSGDGGPATAANLSTSENMAAGPDGSLYIAQNSRIRRIGPDGIITTVAGKGTNGFSGDGGPATSATLSGTLKVAVSSDGSLYIADQGNFRIRRVGPDGIITTVAGKGTIPFSGDGEPAISAGLGFVNDVAVGADGSLYLATVSRIRRIGPDGIITTVAGDGTQSLNDIGDGGPATSARFYTAWSIAVGPDGSLFIGDNERVRRVGLDGIIATVAGNGLRGFSKDGVPATSTTLNTVIGLAAGRDGSLYVVDSSFGRIRRIGAEGIITTVAGNGNGNPDFGSSGDSGPATSASIAPRDVVVGADGSLYISDWTYRIRRVGPSWPGSVDEQIIPSEDGNELYQFGGTGRHLKTLNPLTASVIYQFAYDTSGRLSSITDANSNITRIERDAIGSPVAIIAPFGQRTTLGLNANGYLSQLGNPAGENYQMAYTSDGLLTTFTEPNSNSSTFGYEPGTGRLLSDTNATGAAQTLAKTAMAKGYEVQHKSSLGRINTNRVEYLITGDQLRMNTQPDNTRTLTVNGTNGVNNTTLADGSITTLAQSGDPRFGMLAPFPSSQTVRTGSLTSTMTATRAVTLANPNNLLSLTSQTDTVTLNGRTSTSQFNAATKTFTYTSAAGRTSTSVIDNLGRVTQTAVPDIQPVNIAYDAKGRLDTVIQGTDLNTRTLAMSYNPQGYPASITDALNRVISYEYDTAGRITIQTLPDNRQIRYDYDANGNLVSLQPPGKQTPHVFKYTSIDQTSSYEPPPVPGVVNSNTTYVYDADRALTQITRPDGKTLNFNYDSAGRLSNQQLQPGNITLDSYTYDTVTGKLNSITGLDGGTLDFTYNGALLTQTAWTGSVAGTVDLTYDNDFRVTSHTVNNADEDALAVAYTYDSDSLLTKAGDLTLARNAQNGLLTGTSLGTVTDSMGYNSFGEALTYKALVATNPLLDEQYSRDKLGRITQKIETIQGAASNTYAYTYDIAGRLTRVQKNGVVQSSYAYDDNGNRLTKTGSGTTINGSYDDQDRLISYGNTIYAYTDNGELLSKTVGASVTQYRYDVLGNLRHVDLPAGTASTAIDYVIDGQDRRIGKKVGGILRQGFLYQDGLKVIAELDGNNAIVSRFVYATHVNVPDYMIKGGITYRIITDHLGSPRLVVQVDGATPGQVVQRMDYDEFGNVLADSNPGFQPFGFAGGLYDRDTKLVRFGVRDYDAMTGRWTVKDPIRFAGNSLNFFEYASNDPVNFIDVYGLQGEVCPKNKPKYEWAEEENSSKMLPKHEKFSWANSTINWSRFNEIEDNKPFTEKAKDNTPNILRPVVDPLLNYYTDPNSIKVYPTVTLEGKDLYGEKVENSISINFKKGF